MIHIETSHLRLDLRPEEGACVWSMDFLGYAGWQPVLVPDPGETEGALNSGLFWMLPFANRTRQNRLHAVQIIPNTAEPLALHGSAWSQSWNVETIRDGYVQLSLSCHQPEAPFPFSAGLHVQIDGATFKAQLRLRNEATHIIPAGLGVHPYFPRLSRTTLQFEASHFYLEGPDHLPTVAITLPPELDFATGAPLPQTWRNNAYGGWQGNALIRQPELGYELLMQSQAGMRELMLYTAPGLARFALEPQSHTSGATLEDAPKPQVGLAVLQPGQILSGEVALTLSPMQ
jgi:aldose 1-epimerase